MHSVLRRVPVGLTIGVAAAVLLSCGIAGYVFAVQQYESRLETARATSLAQAELIRAALEHQMIERDRSLIGRMVAGFAAVPGVDAVMILDRLGVVQYSSLPAGSPASLDIESPTCQACHRLPPDQRTTSRVVEAHGGTMLRTVVPFRNAPACYGCHSPAQRINGILIFDLDAGGLRAAVDRDMRRMVIGTGLLSLLLIGLVALVVRMSVLRRLQRFETTARLIAGGDLARRVPADGSDTIAWLAREFNSMADAVTGLLGDVRAERERLETVINSIGDGIVVLDPRRQVVAANDAFLGRAGRVRDDVLGTCCQDLSPGLCTVADCPTRVCLESGESQVRLCERHNPDGTMAWEEVHASPIRDASGRLVQIVEVWRDISERRATEARLADAHRLASLGLLASGFSHELNTPLATVLTCVEGIGREARQGPTRDPDIARIAEHATIARDQVLRCRSITQHFLRLSRGQASSGDLVDLGATVTAVARLVEPTARVHGVRVNVGTCDEHLHVRADEGELQHALINLMVNGIQACTSGGSVTVTAHVDADVRLRVTDDGCGITAEHQRRIFEPFFSMRTGGSGLGLFLALSFVRRWGGDIVVRSVAGAGSTFEIVLPALAPARVVVS